MYIAEYLTDWPDGETVLNRIECKTYTDAEMIINQAKYSIDEFTTLHNHDFRIEEVS